MTDWKEYKLGDLIKINALSIKKDFEYDTIKYIDTSSVTNNIFEKAEEISLVKAPSRAKRIVKDGDTIISTVRPIQKHFGFIKNPSPNTIASTGFAVLTPLKINPKFLYYYLSQENITLYLNAIAETTTTTFPAFRPEILAEMQVIIPTNDYEQQAIAEILSSLDDKIELNNRINQNLEELARNLFKRWFVDFEFPNENGEPYQSSGGEMVDSELGMFPKGWEVTRLDDHVNVERGLSYKGKGLVGKEEGIPMHNLNSIYEGSGYKYEGIKYYNGEYKERHVVKPWDIIVSNTEQGHKYLLIGYPAIVPKYFGNLGIFSQHIYKVTSKKDSHLTHQFLYYLLLTPLMREQIIGCTNGTTVNMLSKDGLQQPKFVYPNNNFVKKFTEIIRPIWEKSELIYVENQSLTVLRDTLLPKLMSGKLTIQEAEQETSNVL